LVGTFGKVKLAVHQYGGQTVAVKIVSRRSLTSHRMDVKIKREISIMKLFNHPNIVRLYEVGFRLFVLNFVGYWYRKIYFFNNGIYFGREFIQLYCAERETN
jgi:serine/threonine protein kinase